MRKKRDTETPQERLERTNRNTRQRDDDRAAEDDAIDSMVKQNIQLHGP